MVFFLFIYTFTFADNISTVGAGGWVGARGNMSIRDQEPLHFVCQYQ